MPDCELLLTCPFFNEMTQNTNELIELYKESYCQGYYTWCGRYMAFKALERELKTIKSTATLVDRRNGDEQR